MNAREALYHLGHWPRFTSRSTKPWTPNSRGKYLLVDFLRLPENVDKVLRTLNRRGKFDHRSLAWIDVKRAELWCLQSRVQYRKVAFFVRNFSKAQRWRADRLPIIFQIEFKRSKPRWVLWNGHHRMFAARLLGRKLRCAIFRISPAQPKPTKRRRRRRRSGAR
jgi:hypothetical protein